MGRTILTRISYSNFAHHRLFSLLRSHKSPLILYNTTRRTNSNSLLDLHTLPNHPQFHHTLHIRHSRMIPRLHGPTTLRLKHTTRNPARFKKMINVLQHQLIRLREETIHNGYPTRAEHRENNECLPSNTADCNRGDLYDSENAHPVYESAECLTSRTNSSGGHFGRVEPGNGEPPDAEEYLEDEDEGCSCVGC